MLAKSIHNLETIIPQMLSFVTNDIDRQPWESSANVTYNYENKELEADLMPLIRDAMAHAIIPSLFGRAFMEKYPQIVDEIQKMDSEMMFFVAGLPWWMWPSTATAQYARGQAWQATTRFHEALDASVDDRATDAWGDLDDVSEFIMKRHEVFRSRSFVS